MGRRLAPELMDGTVGDAEMAVCLRHLAAINRWTGAHRPTLAWLARFRRSEPLNILDVGCGGGDGLRRIARWAERQGIAVRLTGLDRSPAAIHAARAATPEGAVRYVLADVFAFDEPADLIVSGLFAHHLDDAEVVRFLGWMEARARLGWLVNDLHRHPLPYAVVRAAAAVLPLSPLVRHDAPVSVGRAFTPADWQALLRRAGIAAQVRRRLPYRLCVERVR